MLPADKSKLYPDWYNRVEPKLRDLVWLLRNNGFNTTCSCEHEMVVEMEDCDVMELYTLLVEDGHYHFIIVLTVIKRPDELVRKLVRLMLPLPDGTFSLNG